MGLITRIGQWLDKRFPEKVIVSVEDYASVQASIETLHEAARAFSSKAATLEQQIDTLVKRISVIETNTAERSSVEKALNELDKRVTALMLGSNIQQYAPTDYSLDDPLNIIESLRKGK